MKDLKAKTKEQLISEIEELRKNVLKNNNKIEKSKNNFASSRSVSKYKKALEVLKESEERFKALSNATFEAVFISENGIIIDTNKTAIEMSGYSYSELIGKLATDLTSPEFKELVKSNMLSGYEKPYEAKVLKKDGSKIPVEIRGKTFKYNEKKVRASAIRDLSAQKDAEKELIKAKEKAEESDRLKSSFLTIMSHELRTPLNAIIGFSNMLSSNSELSEIDNFSKIINSNGLHLLSIIEDLFDISTIESGVIKMVYEKFDIKDLIDDVHEICVFDQIVSEKEHINFRTVNKDNRENIKIFTDYKKLKQILINLIKNAFKFTHEGIIEYGYNIAGNNTCLFFVRDTGIGITQNQKEYIFDRFRIGDETNTREFGGMGLGLAISKKLVDRLGGKIWVDSKEGKGSTFYFTIPFIKPDSLPDTERVLKEKPTAECKYNWEKYTLLVVEDDESSYLLLKAILKSTKIKIITANNGETAIELFKDNPDISHILMDLKMPFMDGYETTKNLKNLRNDIPIIAQTAFAMVGDKEKALKEGCDDYIPKPYDKKTIIETIAKYI